MVDSLKSTLADVPSRDADNIWQTFLRWLDEKRKSPTFDRTRSATDVTSEFHKISSEARSALEEATLLNDPEVLAGSITSLIKQLMAKKTLYEASPLGSNVSHLVAEIEALRHTINGKEA